MDIPSIESLLRKHNIRLKKKLGQHFLTRKPILEKIINAVGIRHGDDVLEIGAGLGVMTAMMSPLARKIYAIDKDATLAKIFEQEFASIPNIQYMTMDFLNLDFTKDLPDVQFPLKVVGNIPYNISTPIMFKLLDNKNLLSSAVLTIQQEVAKRILARPNTKDYGILSIMLQSEASIHKLFDIRPACFLPPPEVISTVIRIDFGKPISKDITDKALFKKLVKAAFGQRRKTLKNALTGSKSLGISPPLIFKALTECGIDPSRRPETLLITEYIKLTDYLALAIK